MPCLKMARLLAYSPFAKEIARSTEALLALGQSLPVALKQHSEAGGG